MSIRGVLSTMPIKDLLNWIESHRPVGLLRVRCGEEVHVFHFDKGVIGFEASNIPGQQLGQLLLSRGLVDEHALNKAFSHKEKNSCSFGKSLLEACVVEEATLQEVLEVKLREAIWSVLSWQNGVFEFIPGRRKASEFPIYVKLSSTLELGRLQVRRWRYIRTLIPRDSMRFWVADNFSVHNPETSDRVHWQIESILDCVVRGMTANQIVLEHFGRRFQVLSLLAELVGRKALLLDRRSVPRSRQTSRSAEELGDVARCLSKEGKKIEAYSLSLKALKLEPGHEGLQQLNKDLQRSVIAILSQEFLGEYRVPRCTKTEVQIEDYPLNDHQKYVLKRVDGVWDLLSLIRLLPLREIDALLAFKKLYEYGIIEF